MANKGRVSYFHSFIDIFCCLLFRILRVFLSRYWNTGRCASFYYDFCGFNIFLDRSSQRRPTSFCEFKEGGKTYSRRSSSLTAAKSLAVSFAPRRMGIATVAVYSDADARAPFVQLADEAAHKHPVSVLAGELCSPKSGWPATDPIAAIQFKTSWPNVSK